MKLVILLATLLSFSLVTDAQARLLRQRTRTVTTVAVSYASPADAAVGKANAMAARGIRGHLGGGFGGANAEGVGWGGSAESALSACCFSGQRPLAASAVAWSARLGQWVAVKIFW